MTDALWQLGGWTMIHFLWLGTAVALLGIALRFACRRAAPGVRYSSSLMTLAALAATPITIAVWLAINADATTLLQPRALPGDSATVEREPTSTPGQRPELQNAAPQVVIDLAHTPPLPQQTLPLPSPRRGGAGGGVSSTDDVAISASTITVATVVARLPWLWLIGAPLTFALLASGLVGSERLRRKCTALTEGPAAAACEQLRQAMRITRRVSVAVCDHLAQPVLIGILRPLILLPASALSGWTPAELEMVLVHELAHVRRWDNLVNLLQRIIESALFFHPAVWLVSRQVRRDREECCDAVVVSRIERPHDYAALLVSIAAKLQARRPAALAAASAMADHPLTGRIRRILKLEDESMGISQRTLALTLALPLLLVAAAIYSGAAAQNPPPSKGGARGGIGRIESANSPSDAAFTSDSDSAADDSDEDKANAEREKASQRDWLDPEVELPRQRAEIERLEKQIAEEESKLASLLANLDVLKAFAGEKARSPEAVEKAIAAILDMNPAISDLQQKLFDLQEVTQGHTEESKNFSEAEREQVVEQSQRVAGRLTQLRAAAKKSAREQISKLPNEVFRTALIENTIRHKAATANLKKHRDELIGAERKLAALTLAAQNTTVTYTIRPAAIEKMQPYVEANHNKMGLWGYEWAGDYRWIRVTANKYNQARFRILVFKEDWLERIESNESTANAPFPSLEDQKIADRAYKLVGVDLEPISDDELSQVKELGYEGGLRVGNLPEVGGFMPGDILVGLHVWPINDLNSLDKILVRDDLQELAPLKYRVVRSRGAPFGGVGGAPQLVTGRINVNRDALYARELAGAPEQQAQLEAIGEELSTVVVPDNGTVLTGKPRPSKEMLAAVTVVQPPTSNGGKTTAYLKIGKVWKYSLSPQQLELFTMNQIGLVKSSAVTMQAIKLVGLEPNLEAAGRLGERLQASFPGDGEIMELSLTADEISPEENRKVLKAIMDAYQQITDQLAKTSGAPQPVKKDNSDPLTAPQPQPADADDPFASVLERRTSPQPIYLYDGKPFNEWRNLWKHELNTERRTEAIEALAAFARAGYGKEAAETILDVAGEYDFKSYDESTEGKLRERVAQVLTLGRASRVPATDWLPALNERLAQDPDKWRPLIANLMSGGVPETDYTLDPATRKLLLQMASDPNYGPNAAALRALYSRSYTDKGDPISDPEVAPLIKAALAGEDVANALAVLRMLSFGQLDQWPQQLDFLFHEDAAASRTARTILQWSGAQSRQAAAERLTAVLDDPQRAEDHADAIRALGVLLHNNNRKGDGSRSWPDDETHKRFSERFEQITRNGPPELLVPAIRALGVLNAVGIDNWLGSMDANESEEYKERIKQARDQIEAESEHLVDPPNFDGGGGGGGGIF